MSAYMLDNMDLSAIASTLVNSNWMPKDKFTACELAERLYDMNAKAVRARYANANEAGMIVEFEYTARIPLGSVALYVALDSLLYQSSEGDVPKSAMYEMVRAVTGHVANSIIRELAAFKAARKP